MLPSTRRTVLTVLFGAGATGGLQGLFAPLQAAPALPLRLPDTPLRLERLLQRGIGDAAVITVRRGWQVHCKRQGRGIVATGRQITAEVSAPPHLEALAQIERGRDASSMFPLMMSDAGLILTPGSEPAPADMVANALTAAEALIASQPVPADERERYRLYLAQVHQAGATLLDTLPPDLFFPASPAVELSQAVALPGGLTGHFSLRYTAESQPDAPWLKRAERRLVTEVGGLTRSASEVWTLA
jgi:hypothetical protein